MAPGVSLDYGHPPFDLLDAQSRRTLERSLDLVYFARGETLIRAGEPSDHVLVILQGRVQAVDARNSIRERFSEYASGDVMGAFAVIAGRARHSYEALEDTLCHSIPANVFRQLMSAVPRFAAWFQEGLSAKRQLLAEKSHGAELGELMLTRVADAELAPAVSVSPAITLADARALMKQAGVSCLIVEATGLPRGIVTRTDLLDALALEGRSRDESVAPLVRRPLVSIRPHEVLFQALVSMTEKHVERVVVEHADGVLGTLGLAEVLSHFSSHSHLIGMRLARARSVADVQSAALGMNALVATLFAQGAKMSFLMEMVSALNTRILSSLFGLLVPEPLHASVCLLVLGSEGRQEQILKTDQDNALVLADDLAWPEAEAITRQFSEALAGCGYPPCPGNIMLSNTEWRLPVRQWRERIARWRSSTDPARMLEFAIAVDARAVAGNLDLFESLRPELLAASGNDLVLHHFARATLDFHTPLSLFGRLKAGDHGTDIKKGGVFPIVHGLRALALRHGISDRNSFRRADALVASGALSAELARDVQQALSVFMRLRLAQQLDNVRAGLPPDNFLRVHELSRLDRELLRDALRVVNEFKHAVRTAFRLEG